MKTYDELIQEINDVNKQQNIPIVALPHCSNLLFQLEKKPNGEFNLFAGKKDKLTYLNNIVERYLQIRRVKLNGSDYDSYIQEITEATNAYMNLLWPTQNNPFSHQADFTSSIIPEMLCCIFCNIIESKGMSLGVSAQKDLTIECLFDFTNGGTVRFKNKRVDVTVFKDCKLSLDDCENEFPIPLIAIECKTNLDKNMLSGIEHSVQELKKTFPQCYYLVVTELSDFDEKKTNYASSDINEVYVLRKQKRAKTRKAPYFRKNLDSSLIKEIAELFIKGLDGIDVESKDLVEKMKSGKLIGRLQ